MMDSTVRCLQNHFYSTANSWSFFWAERVSEAILILPPIEMANPQRMIIGRSGGLQVQRGPLRCVEDGDRDSWASE